MAQVQFPLVSKSTVKLQHFPLETETDTIFQASQPKLGKGKVSKKK